MDTDGRGSITRQLHMKTAIAVVILNIAFAAMISPWLAMTELVSFCVIILMTLFS